MIEQKVITQIAESLQIDTSRITSEASFAEDLEVDSLDAVKLIMDLEDLFDIEIEDHIARKWKTVADVLEYITGEIG